MTKANGRVGATLADALVPHPASNRLVVRIMHRFLFMDYGFNGVIAVAVGVGGGSVVGICVEVAVGGSLVGTSVVGTGCEVFDAVGVFGMSVTPGVRVGTFGTQSLCPTKIVVEDPIQFARCNWETVTP